MKIRTITAGLTLDSEASQLAGVIEELGEAGAAFAGAGYEVQTTRVAMQPLDHLVGEGQPVLHELVSRVGAVCEAQEFQFLSLGPINSQGDTVLADASAQALTEYEVLNASMALVVDGHVDRAACRTAAEVIKRLSRDTPGGIGNFRFAATANCPPGIPFFPSAFHDGGATTMAIGLQSADLVEEAFSGAQDLTDASARLVATFDEALSPIADLGRSLAERLKWRYLGIDLSPAPMAEVSIARAFEGLGYGAFGECGTLSIAGLATQALEQVGVKHCGFSGLMFPVLEDTVLGQRNAEGRFDIQDLLLYSAVCGTGLDTVPIPGDASAGRIEHLLYDLASLSTRLSKPLSARLFPVPGKAAGEMTAFESPYLTNTTVMDL